MKKRTMSSMIAIATLALALACTAGAERASAQACCIYLIDVAGIPATCFPIATTTVWSSGIAQSFTVAVNGTYTDVIANCPPIPTLVGVSVAGGPLMPIGGTGSVTLGCGVTITYTAGLAGGCLYITIR
jgi:hypothetical protein